MPRINIYEHSETYSFQTKNNSYATVAFPIAAIWGPTFVEGDEDLNPDWVHFSAGYRGTTDFVQTFRGANNYLGAREKSYDYALKLLAAGYDILVKRVDGLGAKSANSIMVVPAGIAEPIPADAMLALNLPPAPNTLKYGVFPYRALLNHLVDNKITWDYEFDGSDDLDIHSLTVIQTYDETTKKWSKTSGIIGQFGVVAKTAIANANSPVIVAIGKPNIITSTQSATTTKNVYSVDNTLITGNGRMVTLTGTVPISVYSDKGVLLERRTINMTETVEYKYVYGNSSHTANLYLTVKSVQVPEFTYIQLTAIPPLLSLKTNLMNDITNIFATDTDDFKYGYITARLGSAWAVATVRSATATVTSANITTASVDALIFANKVEGVDGTYEFKYDNGTLSWKLNDTAVNLSAYGITVGTGVPATGDTITVAFTNGYDTNYMSGGSGTAAVIDDATQRLKITAKYPGTFGNNLKVRIKCGTNGDGYKIGTVEVFDNNGYNDHPNEIVTTDQLLELISVAFEAEAATDNRPLITEASFSNLGTIQYTDGLGNDIIPAEYPTGTEVISLLYGTNYQVEIGEGDDARAITAADVKEIVAERFSTDSSYYNYIKRISEKYEAEDMDNLIRLYNQQMMYKRFYNTVGELTDPIVYDWDALVQGIADDQYVPKSFIEANSNDDDPFIMEYEVSTLVIKMLEVAANSKCGAALIGTPFGMPRGIQTGSGSLTVKTGALKYKDSVSQAVGTTYSTFGEVVGPWCKTTLALAGANSWIAPEIAHLLLIINAKGVGGMNKWWMVPAGMLGTGIVHTPEYKIKKKYLDLIQDHDEGVCLNPLMEVPGKGFTCFGNSTLWDKPLGTYNALQNLSTRFLTNRVKQRIWDTALQILFRYNNEDAYSHFYAGLSPLLDEMRAVGALTGNEYNPWGYRIVMNPDIVNLDRINANTVIGKVELAVTGVIDTVDVDLFLLPPTGFQETYD